MTLPSSLAGFSAEEFLEEVENHLPQCAPDESPHFHRLILGHHGRSRFRVATGFCFESGHRILGELLEELG